MDRLAGRPGRRAGDGRHSSTDACPPPPPGRRSRSRRLCASSARSSGASRRRSGLRCRCRSAVSRTSRGASLRITSDGTEGLVAPCTAAGRAPSSARRASGRARAGGLDRARHDAFELIRIRCQDPDPWDGSSRRDPTVTARDDSTMAKALRFVVGIDQGTTSTKAFRLRQDGEFVPLCSVEHRQFYPQAGWVEHDPLELLAAVEQCLDASAGAAVSASTNQGRNRRRVGTRRPASPSNRAIVWAGTGRTTNPTSNNCGTMAPSPLTRARAGLPPSTRTIAASKLRWLLDHAPGRTTTGAAGAPEGSVLPTPSSWTACAGCNATDVTTASRTSLMNLATGTLGSRAVPAVRCADQPPAAHPAVGASVRGDPRMGAAAHGVNRRPAGGPLRPRLSCPWRYQDHLRHRRIRPRRRGRQATSGRRRHAADGPAWRHRHADPVRHRWWRVQRCVSAELGASLGLFTDLRELDGFPGPTAIERGVVFVPALSGLACPYWDRSAAGLVAGHGARDHAQAHAAGRTGRHRPAQRSGGGRDRPRRYRWPVRYRWTAA